MVVIKLCFNYFRPTESGWPWPGRATRHGSQQYPDTSRPRSHLNARKLVSSYRSGMPYTVHDTHHVSNLHLSLLTFLKRGQKPTLKLSIFIRRGGLCLSEDKNFLGVVKEGRPTFFLSDFFLPLWCNSSLNTLSSLP